MILTIDAGNTNTVLGVFEDEELKKEWYIATDKKKTADEYGILFNNLFDYERLDIGEVSNIAISSVVPPVIPSLRKAAQCYFQLEPLIVGPGIKTGINIKMDNPREVGADRIVNAVAAYHKFKAKNIIIVDFSTATSVDAISENGDYLGGATAPGVGISTEALFRSAAMLPRVELKKPKKAVAKNIVTALQSGIIYGFVGQVEALVKHFKEEVGEESFVIATGPLAHLIAPEATIIDKIEPSLALEGLRYIVKLNQEVITSKEER